MNSCEYIVIHHSASAGQGEQFQSINAYHQRKGFPLSRLGYHAGYHYVLERSGRRIQARDDEERGAHTVSLWPAYWNMNNRGIGICLAGDFTKEQVGIEQLKALRLLVDELRAKHGIPMENVILHRQAKSTSCPGVDFVYLMESLTEPTRTILPYDIQLAQTVKAINRYAGREPSLIEGMRLRRLLRKKERLEELIAQSR